MTMPDNKSQRFESLTSYNECGEQSLDFCSLLLQKPRRAHTLRSRRHVEPLPSTIEDTARPGSLPRLSGSRNATVRPRQKNVSLRVSSSLTTSDWPVESSEAKASRRHEGCGSKSAKPANPAQQERHPNRVKVSSRVSRIKEQLVSSSSSTTSSTHRSDITTCHRQRARRSFSYEAEEESSLQSTECSSSSATNSRPHRGESQRVYSRMSSCKIGVSRDARCSDAAVSHGCLHKEDVYPSGFLLVPLAHHPVCKHSSRRPVPDTPASLPVRCRGDGQPQAPHPPRDEKKGASRRQSALGRRREGNDCSVSPRDKQKQQPCMIERPSFPAACCAPGGSDRVPVYKVTASHVPSLPRKTSASESVKSPSPMSRIKLGRQPLPRRLPCQLKTLATVLTLRHFSWAWDLETSSSTSIGRSFMREAFNKLQFHSKLARLRENNSVLARTNLEAQSRCSSLLAEQERLHRDLAEARRHWEGEKQAQETRLEALRAKYREKYRRLKQEQETLTALEQRTQKALGDAQKEKEHKLLELTVTLETLQQERLKSTHLSTELARASQRLSEKEEALTMAEEDRLSLQYRLIPELNRTSEVVKEKEAIIENLRLSLHTSLQQNTYLTSTLEHTQRDMEEAQRRLMSPEAKMASLANQLQLKVEECASFKEKFNKLQRECSQHVIEQERLLRQLREANATLLADNVKLKASEAELRDKVTSLEKEIQCHVRTNMSSRLALEKEIADLKFMCSSREMPKQQNPLLQCVASNSGSLRDEFADPVTQKQLTSLSYGSSLSTLPTLSDVAVGSPLTLKNPTEPAALARMQHCSDKEATSMRPERGGTLRVIDPGTSPTTVYIPDEKYQTIMSEDQRRCHEALRYDIPEADAGNSNVPSSGSISSRNSTENSDDHAGIGITALKRSSLSISTYSQQTQGLRLPSKESLVYGHYPKSQWRFNNSPISESEESSTLPSLEASSCMLDSTALSKACEFGASSPKEDGGKQNRSTDSFLDQGVSWMPQSRTPKRMSTTQEHLLSRRLRRTHGRRGRGRVARRGGRRIVTSHRSVLHGVQWRKRRCDSDASESLSSLASRSQNPQADIYYDMPDGKKLSTSKLRTGMPSFSAINVGNEPAGSSESIDIYKDRLERYSSQCRMAYVELYQQTERFDALAQELQRYGSPPAYRSPEDLKKVHALRKTLAGCRWVLEAAHIAREEAAKKRFETLLDIEKLQQGSAAGKNGRKTVVFE